MEYGVGPGCSMAMHDRGYSSTGAGRLRGRMNHAKRKNASDNGVVRNAAGGDSVRLRTLRVTYRSPVRSRPEEWAFHLHGHDAECKTDGRKEARLLQRVKGP